MSSILSLPSLPSALSSSCWFLASETLLVAAIIAIGCWLAPSPAAPAPLVSKLPAVETLAAPRACKTRTVSIQDLGPPKRLFEDILTNTVTRGEDAQDLFLRPIPPSQVCAPAPQGGDHKPERPRKEAKRVLFAEAKNEVRLVENWIMPEYHIHAAVTGHVRWELDNEIWLVEKWIVPCGHVQLHFPRTKWVRGGPDLELEDFDGDIEMGDA